MYKLIMLICVQKKGTNLKNLMQALGYFKLIFILLCLGLYKPAYAQIDMEALDTYWSITDSLKADKDISSYTWNEFFHKKANLFFMKAARDSAKFKERIIRNLKLAYMPSQKLNLQSTTPDLFLKHIIYVRDHEDEIKKYAAFVQQGSVIDSMYRLAYQYLPMKYQTRVSDLKIYYSGPLAIDAVASHHEIYINIGIDYITGLGKIGLIGAHELFHLLIPKWGPKKPVGPKHVLLVIFLKELSNEGSADLVDKKYVLLQKKDSIYRPFLEKTLKRSDSLVAMFNKEIELLSKENQTRPKFKPITLSGHTPGFYMALIIERNGYLPELLDSIDNPFSFIYIYNKAAKKDNTKPPVFSSTSINYLKSIE